jgi:hypothetical protein
LAHGRAAVDWMRSSGVAERMLADICCGVEKTVALLVGDDCCRAREILSSYPCALRCCDRPEFDEAAEAIAYLILHLPDRYCRMFRALERLLVSGRLPMGKSNGFAAMDIGAGPGPGIFAVRAFYAALGKIRGPTTATPGSSAAPPPNRCVASKGQRPRTATTNSLTTCRTSTDRGTSHISRPITADSLGLSGMLRLVVLRIRKSEAPVSRASRASSRHRAAFWRSRLQAQHSAGTASAGGARVASPWQLSG